jgi:non-haem Fe2+, alpha-ketoglutarate-dependent halogenase
MHDHPSAYLGPLASADPEVAFFEENGFLGPIKLYEPEHARELLRDIRIHNQDRRRALYDNDVNYDRHFDIPELTQHIGHPGIVERLKKILGPDLFCWRTEFFPKFPGSKATEWHQVSNYRYATGTPMLEPVSPWHRGPLDLTVWTTFTEATRENGCMKFLPGSHKKTYYDESKPVTAGRDGTYVSIQAGTQFFGYNFEDFKVDPEWVPDESQAAVIEMNAGECVIFTARCVHGSMPNVTARSTRFAISSRYVPSTVRVYPDWKEFFAHGGHFDLTHYGVVLVSGVDRFGHNRMRLTNNWGQPFLSPQCGSTAEAV